MEGERDKECEFCMEGRQEARGERGYQKGGRAITEEEREEEGEKDIKEESEITSKNRQELLSQVSRWASNRGKQSSVE